MRKKREASPLNEVVAGQGSSKGSKAESNRRNAEKSTGPDDTSLTRFNATKHGLLAAAVRPVERDGYEDMLVALQDEFCPRGVIENILIERVALYAIRLRRAAAMQMEFIDHSMKPKPPAKMRRRSGFEKFFLGDQDDETDGSSLGTLKEAVKGLPSALEFLTDGSAPEDMDQLRATLDRFSAAVESLAPAKIEEPEPASVPVSPATMDALDQKYQRYETTVENRLYRTLHELERLQRLRAGDLVPAPVTIDLAIHSAADLM